MKLTLQIDIPEIKEVECPTEYETPIRVVEHEREVRQIKCLLEYLQRLDDIEWIINSDHQHVRAPYCRELVRSRLDFIPENSIHTVGETLSYFLMGFREGVGYDFKEARFEYNVLSTGNKFKFDKYLHTFNTKEEAVSWYINMAVSNKDYVVKEMF